MMKWLTVGISALMQRGQESHGLEKGLRVLMPSHA